MSSPAFLHGYDRWRVKDHAFPAIVKSENIESCIEGVLVKSLTPNELRAFDFFEDIEYERVDVNVRLGDLDELIEAQAYVWRADNKWIEYGKHWSYDRFRRESLDWYLGATVKPCREEIDRLQLL